MPWSTPPDTPTPPTPPSAVASGQQSASQQRYVHGDHEVQVQAQGQVAVRDSDQLDLPAGARLHVQVRRGAHSATLVWDASGCTVQLAAAPRACERSEREFAVAQIRQLPTPPIPPRMR